jgi:cytochrome c peroxidase
MKTAGMIFLIPALSASLALAADPSMERGKELFNGTTLGTNGKSCATCHQEGKRLESVVTYEEGELADIVNRCIEKPLKGKAIDPASTDMKSLIMYIRSFADAGK